MQRIVGIVALLAALGLPIPADAQTQPDALAHDVAAACASSGSRSGPSRLAETEATVNIEASKYGTFSWSSDAAGCHVAFRRTSGATTTVLTTAISNCKSDANMIQATKTLGALALPVVNAKGDEFHAFTLTCCGGSAVTYESWVVVVNGSGAWGGPVNPIPLMTDAGLQDNHLFLERSPTATSTGDRYSIAFGSSGHAVLPKVQTSVTSKVTHVFSGTLRRGAHYEACGIFPIVMTVGPDEFAVDQAGSCALQPAADRGGNARLTAEVTKWSDGRADVKCISIQ